jgi:hypothetical protein
MKLSGLFYSALFLLIIILSAGIYAQDSTIVNVPQRLVLIDGTILTGKIVSKDSLTVQIQLNNGDMRTVRKAHIKRSELVANKYRELTSGRNLKLELKDGSDVVGKIVSITDTTLFFRSLSGIEMTIPIFAITDYEELNGDVIGDIYYRKDPNQSRLFIAPTAQPIGSGKVYFSDYMVFFPSFAAGLGNFVSVGAGMTLIPGVEDELFYLNLKITVANASFNKNNLCFAVGGMYANSTASNSEGQSIIYGLGTYSRSIFSFTLGIFDLPPNNGGESIQLFLFGGDLRLSQSVKLISENYYSSNDNTGVYSLGLRFFGEKVAADFGLFTTAEAFRGSGFPFLPWVGFAYNF